MLRTSSVLIVLAMIGGCAATPKDQPVADADAKVVCHRDYKLGSNVATTICEVPPTEAERQQQIDALRQNIRPNVHPSGAGG